MTPQYMCGTHRECITLMRSQYYDLLEDRDRLAHRRPSLTVPQCDRLSAWTGGLKITWLMSDHNKWENMSSYSEYISSFLEWKLLQYYIILYFTLYCFANVKPLCCNTQHARYTKTERYAPQSFATWNQLKMSETYSDLTKIKTKT